MVIWIITIVFSDLSQALTILAKAVSNLWPNLSGDILKGIK